MQRCQLVRFLPYFVCFLKENTAVRFFPPKYIFFFFSIFFFFFFFIFFLFFFYFFNNTGEWKFYITHIIYVMKTWSEFLNDDVKKRLRLHQRAPKTRVFPDPGRKDFVLRARDARSARKSPQICFFKLNNNFFLNDRLAAMQFAPSPSLFFYKILFFGSKYCFFPSQSTVFGYWRLASLLMPWYHSKYYSSNGIACLMYCTLTLCFWHQKNIALF